MTSKWKKYLQRVLALLLTGAFFVPVSAYLVGNYIVGPYEGDSGLAGFLGSIYRGAWHGDRAAWILILTPILIVSVWLMALWLYRRAQSRHPPSQPDPGP